MISTTSSNIDVATGNFSIELNASMFTMLTKNVYTDTILAPIREWSTNAIDACIAAGTDPCFDVHLPTVQTPTFSVRDYGTGLSPEDIETLFATLGASTKRDSNDYNGTFGIGRLSGLAYSTSFTVESYFNQTHYSYLISIKDGIPIFLKLSEAPSLDPSGLKLSLAVEAKDISRFVEKATFLYRFFAVKPTTNIPLTYTDPSLSGSNWNLYPDISYTYVLMANVPYRLNYTDIRGCVISVPTGSVSITPGRETLTYDAATERYLDSLISQTKADIAATTIAQAQASTPSLFLQTQAIASANNAIYSLRLKPSDLHPSASTYFTDHFTLRDVTGISPMSIGKYDSKLTNAFNSSYSDHLVTTILIQDLPSNFLSTTITAFESLSLTKRQLILRPTSNTKSAIETLLACYPAYLKAIGLDHVPVVHISTYATESTKAVSTKLASSIFQPTSIHGSKLPNIDLSTYTETRYFLYETPSNVSIYNNLEVLLGLKFLVLPKKIHSTISNFPNFIEATDSVIQSLLDTHTFQVVDPDVRTLGDRVYYFKDCKSTRYDFKAIYDYCYTKVPVDYLSQIQSLQACTSFKFNTSVYSHPIHSDDIYVTYPKLEAIKRETYNRKIFDIYIALEDQLHALSNSSGLNSPSISISSNHP